MIVEIKLANFVREISFWTLFKASTFIYCSFKTQLIFVFNHVSLTEFFLMNILL